MVFLSDILDLKARTSNGHLVKLQEMSRNLPSVLKKQLKQQQIVFSSQTSLRLIVKKPIVKVNTAKADIPKV